MKRAVNRARAIALRRHRPDPTPLLFWLLLALALLTAGAALAQTPTPTAPTLPPGSGGDRTAPVPPSAVKPDVPGGTSSNGVATPRPNQDPGIVAPTPAAPSGMPVIRPPNTGGGTGSGTTVVPK